GRLGNATIARVRRPTLFLPHQPNGHRERAGDPRYSLLAPGRVVVVDHHDIPWPPRVELVSQAPQGALEARGPTMGRDHDGDKGCERQRYGETVACRHPHRSRPPLLTDLEGHTHSFRAVAS